MHKKIIYCLVVVFLVTSCGNTVDSVKRGLTGAKSKSTDEFLVQKKDPLVLPPNYEDLPLPSGEQAEEEEEVFSLETTLNKTSMTESESSTASTTEESILQKIRKR